MKNVMCRLIGVILVGGLIICAHVGPAKSQAEEKGLVGGATLVVSPPMVKMSKKAKITIMGAGFKPGQEIRLLFTDVGGVEADIGYALKAEPVANESGAWITIWSCGRYIAKKLIKQGTYSIAATDSEYNFLAHAPVGFSAEK